MKLNRYGRLAAIAGILGLVAGLVPLASGIASDATLTFPTTSAGKVYLVDGGANVSYADGTEMDWNQTEGAFLSAKAVSTTPATTAGYEDLRLPTVSGAEDAITFISAAGKETSPADWKGYGDLVALDGEGVLLPQVTPAYQSNGPSLASVRTDGGQYSLGVAYVKNNGLTVVSAYFTTIDVTASTGKWKFASADSRTVTVTTVASSATSVTVGNSVTLTAAVNPSAATGTVTFKDGTRTLGTGTVTSGVATVSTSALTAGTHAITAVYGGDDSYAGSTSDAVSVKVNANSFTSTPTPKITGTAKIGSTLSVVTGTWTPTPTLAYQWLLNGKTIAGKTNTTLAVASTYGGGTISVRVTGSKSGYTTVAKTSAALSIPKASFTKTRTPTISGKAKVGKKLTAKVGTWSPTATFTYQWLANGKTIKGATKSTLTLTSSLKGKKISVKVTGARVGYNSKALTSKRTAKVAK